MLGSWRRQLCLNNLEVNRTVVIRQDEQGLPVIRHLVHDAGNARLDHDRREMRLFGVDEPHLTGRVIVGTEQNESFRLSLAHAQEEAIVHLLVDELIGALRRAERVTVHTFLAVVVVDDSVDDLLAVCRPHEGRRAIDQHVVELGAGGNISKAYVEILGAFHVSRVGKQRVVW